MGMRQNRRGASYLFQAAGARSREHYGVAAVVVRRHRGHSVILIYEQWNALDGAGATQRLVEVLPAEIVVNL